MTIALPLAGIHASLPALALTGFAIGFLSGTFGAGGGFLLTPLLKVAFGIPYPVAVGSSLAQVFINASVSAWRHWRNGKVDVRLGLLLAVGALMGTEVGVRILGVLSAGGQVVVNGHSMAGLDLVMSLLFLGLMSTVAVIILRETGGASAGQEADGGLARRAQALHLAPMMTFPTSSIALTMWLPLGCSFGVGIFTGLMGVGGAFVSFPLMIYALGVPTHIAVGTSAFQVMFASGYGALRHGLQGNVELALVGALLIGSVVGVQLGVRVSELLGGRKLRRYFALVIAVGVGVLLWDLAQVVLV